MKVKNGELWIAREALNQLISQRLPVKSALALAKFTKKFNEELASINEVRNGLIKKYGQKDEEKGGQLVVGPECEGFDKFQEELQELMDQETEIVVEKIKLPEMVASTCDKCHHNMDRPFMIEPEVLMLLEKFIEV